MCGDNNLPPAPSSGDAIAVIHLQPEHPEPCPISKYMWRLQLSNRFTSEEDSTKISYERKPDWIRSDMKLRIHEYGTSTSRKEICNPIIHQICIDAENTCSSSVGHKLALSVGEDGVIGRTISVEVRGQVIGEGVIGWL
ncbi:hypothetical protein F5884DRAFT_40241 [Xylogone sp. PMI_703]|nr:hypothetical protein F5884DRAFT_40241 [Xylogone sp. PMI_703]